MNTQLYQANQFLSAIAAVNESFINSCIMLQHRAKGQSVTHGIELRKFESRPGCLFEAFLEVETKKDIGYCWWLEFQLIESEWRLKTSLLKSYEGGQDTIETFAELSGTTLDEFLVAIRDASRELMSSAQCFAFDK